jgi:hypothetical protein
MNGYQRFEKSCCIHVQRDSGKTYCLHYEVMSPLYPDDGDTVS